MVRMSIIKRLLIMIFILPILCLQGCEVQKNSTKERKVFQSIDSGFRSGTTGKTQVFWLDNDRVIFFGYEGSKPMTKEEKSKQKDGIFIWDTKTNQVKKYSDGSGLCYHDGYIYYSFSQEFTFGPGQKYANTWKEGPFGAEVPYIKIFTEDEAKKWVKEYTRSHISCQNMKVPRDDMQGRSWIPMLNNNTYLDGGNMNVIQKLERENTKYISEDGSEIQLPIKLSEDYSNVSYVTYKNAYLLYTSSWSREWIDDRCIPIWWLTTNGHVSKECIHIDNLAKDILRWLEKSIGMGGEIYPTVTGNFLIFRHKSEEGHEGVGYLINDKKAEVVMYGIIDEVAVSPDGCKLAFSYAPDFEAVRVGGRGQRTLRSIDLCN